MFVSDWENSRIQRFADDFRATNAWRLPSTPGAWPSMAWDASTSPTRPPAGAPVRRQTASCWPRSAASRARVASRRPHRRWSSQRWRTLWVLGRDALARIDLTPYAALRPTAAADRAARWPLLGILGWPCWRLAGAAVVLAHGCEAPASLDASLAPVLAP